jgi:hypothetical protein
MNGGTQFKGEDMAKIFIGSSRRMLPLVDEIAALLRSLGHEARPWTEAFEHGDITIDRLVMLAREVDGAILVCSGDDKLESGYYQSRPNIMIEIGLFVGHLGRKRTLVCRFGDHKLPSDLGGLTYVDLGDEADHLGSRIRDELSGWAARLGDAIDPVMGEVGISQIYPSFPLSEFCQALHKATRVHILQTFIPYTQHMHHFEEHLLAAIVRGCEVQILLLNPSSSVVELRQRSLSSGYGRETVGRQIVSNLEHLAALAAQLPPDRRERLQVRLHSAMPSMSIYRVDDLFFSGHYFHGSLAIDSPQLKISNPRSGMGRRLANEHDQLWNSKSARVVDLREIDDLTAAS